MLSVPLADRTKQVLELQTSEIEETSSSLPKRARAAALDALDRGETHYTDRPGILPLREEVAAWLKHHYEVSINPKTSVVISCGDTEARFVAVQRLLSPGNILLCLGDASLVAPAVVIRGASLVSEEDANEGLESITGLYLSAATSPDVRDRWFEEAKKQGWWIIFDVTEDENFSFHPATDPALSSRTVTIGGVGYDEGLRSWRVGFFAAPDDEAPELRSFKQSLTICTTNVSQWAALGLLEGAQ